MKLIPSLIPPALVVLTLAGCTNVPLESRAPTPPSARSSASPQTLFLQSFEELAQSDSSPALESLHRDFPESAWARIADKTAELYRSYRQSQRRAGELKTDLSACEAQNQSRREQIDQLKSDLQRLNDLVIEMELRSK